MSVIQVQNLSKSFGPRVLFSDVSFRVEERDRIGLIGPNGSGKTTLLSILCQTLEADSGSVSVSKNCRMESIDQVIDASFDGSLYEIALDARRDLLRMEDEIASLQHRLESGEGDQEKLIRRISALREQFEAEGGLTFRSRTRSALTGLGFRMEDLDRPYASFSGGEIRKAHLARLLLSGANLLILDEPTNHLDILAAEWLENYLVSYDGAILTVSHDRRFLDRVTNRTLELRNGRIIETPGNYSKHLELQMDADKTAERRYNRTLKEIRRLEGVIEQQRRWNQARNYVTIASKQKQIDRLKQDLIPPEHEPDRIRFHFDVTPPPSVEIVRADGLGKSYGGKPLFRDVSFLIKNGEHVCLIGENGCGKTTLLKILLGLEQADEGVCRIGDSVRTGYYAQTASEVTENATLFDRIYDQYPRMEPRDIRNALAAFLFRGEDIGKKLSDLSGGEMARIRLLELMLSHNDTLFLDEPTNYLDIRSREQLEEAIIDFPGTMLVVSHDRYFISRIADRILFLQEDGVTEFSGDWDEFAQFCQQKRQESARKKTTDEPAPVSAYQAGRERRSAIARLRSRYRKAEEQIRETEEEIAGYERLLSSPETGSDYMLTAETAELLQNAQARHEELLAEWIAAGEELAAMEEN